MIMATNVHANNWDTYLMEPMATVAASSDWTFGRVTHDQGSNTAPPRQNHDPPEHQGPVPRSQAPVVQPTSEGTTDLRAFAARFHLAASTAKILEENGFKHNAALRTLRKEDIPQLNITTLAEKRLLEEAIAMTSGGPSRPQTQEETPTAVGAPSVQAGSGGAQPFDDLNARLTHLIGYSAQGVTTHAPASGSLINNMAAPMNQMATGERVDLNPLNYLFQATKVKPLLIVDYVGNTSVSSDQYEHVLGNGEGGQFVYKTAARKPKLENISPTQWTAANMRIMMELLQRKQLDQVSMFDYIAHTIKIAQLADSFTWISVLNYDNAYRELQATTGFRWGSDTTHLTTLHLRPKNTSATTSRKEVWNQSRPVCRLYNKALCPYGVSCKYQHFCLAPGCRQPHPQIQHGKVERNNPIVRNTVANGNPASTQGQGN